MKLPKSEIDRLIAMGAVIGPSANLQAESVPVLVKRPKPVLRGEQAMMIWLELPWPPALNSFLFGSVQKRCSVPKKYKHAVLSAVEEQKVGHVKGRLTCECWAHPPDARRRDLDGLWKLALDSLVFAGVFEDDGQIDHLIVHRDKSVEGGMLTVQIVGEFPKE